MKYIKNLYVLFALILTANLLAVDVTLDEFPRVDPYTDTLRYAMVKNKNPKFYKKGKEVSVLLAKKDKNNPQKRKIKYKIWLQKEPAAVVILMPGIGSNLAGDSPNAIAEIIYDAGFSVILISSAFNWEFIENASSSGVPGFTPVDAQDLYKTLQAILANAKKKFDDYKFDEIILTGYSLGGLHTLFLSEIDAREKKINFKRCVALSPPVNLVYALSRLDEFYEEWFDWKHATLIAQKNKAVAIYRGLDSGDNTGDFTKIVSSNEAKFAIGVMFHFVLSETIKAVCDRNDLKLLETPTQTFTSQELEREIEDYSYASFANTFIKKAYSNLWDSDVTIKHINTLASVPSIAKALYNNDNLTVLHTETDWLISNYDRDWLRKLMGDRLVMLSDGAHLGYFERPDAQFIWTEMLKGQMPLDQNLKIATAANSYSNFSAGVALVKKPEPVLETESATTDDIGPNDQTKIKVVEKVEPNLEKVIPKAKPPVIKNPKTSATKIVASEVDKSNLISTNTTELVTKKTSANTATNDRRRLIFEFKRDKTSR